MMAIYMYLFQWLLRRIRSTIKLSSGRRVYEWTHGSLSIAVAVCDTSVDGFDRFDRVDTLLMLREVRRQEKRMQWRAPDEVGHVTMRMEVTIGMDNAILCPMAIRNLIDAGHAVSLSPDRFHGRIWTSASRSELVKVISEIGMRIVTDERALPDGERITHQNGMSEVLP